MKVLFYSPDREKRTGMLIIDGVRLIPGRNEINDSDFAKISTTDAYKSRLVNQGIVLLEAEATKDSSPALPPLKMKKEG